VIDITTTTTPSWRVLWDTNSRNIGLGGGGGDEESRRRRNEVLVGVEVVVVEVRDRGAAYAKLRCIKAMSTSSSGTTTISGMGTFHPNNMSTTVSD